MGATPSSCRVFDTRIYLLQVEGTAPSRKRSKTGTIARILFSISAIAGILLFLR